MPFNRSYFGGNFRQSVVKSDLSSIVDEYHFLRTLATITEKIVPGTLDREYAQREQLRHTRNEMEVIEAEVNYRLHYELVPSGD